jgi:hypothetical protein
MINLPLNFSAPTGQVQNTYAQPTRTNPYLTSSQYEGIQLHTPSGLFYQGGNVYEPYTVGTKTISTRPSVSQFGGAFYGLGRPRYSTVPDIAEGSIQSGSQYFKPFAGNAQGIINGNLSMAAMAGQNNYQPQGIPSNLFNFLSAPSMQPTNNQQSSGAGRFLGLLGSPIVTTNTQGK